MTQETNKSIDLEFYANATHHDQKSYTSYLKIVGCPDAINTLLDFPPPGLCGIQNRRGINHMLNAHMCEMMKNEIF